jgi:SAM-dependent methyltransferase
MSAYGTDLSFIHDVGFGGFADGAAPGLLELLRRTGIDRGLVIDLGCGSGIWAARLTAEGYDVLGFDQSPAMIALARRKAPEARFETASLFGADIPACAAVTSVGECLNYAFDRTNSRRALKRLFARIYQSLSPGGVFVFDIAEPGQPTTALARRFVQAPEWAVLVEASESAGVLVRRITTYRKTGKIYRRNEETHKLKLYRATDLVADLRAAGFSARTMRSHGDFDLPPAHTAIVARKPGRFRHGSTADVLQ